MRQPFRLFDQTASSALVFIANALLCEGRRQAAFGFLEALRRAAEKPKGSLGSLASHAALEAISAFETTACWRWSLVASAAEALTQALPPLLVQLLLALQQQHQQCALEHSEAEAQADVSENAALRTAGDELPSARSQLETEARAAETCSAQGVGRLPQRPQLECLYSFCR